MGKNVLFILLAVSMAAFPMWANGGNDAEDTGAAISGTFDWKSFDGTSIKIMANKHPSHLQVSRERTAELKTRLGLV